MMARLNRNKSEMMTAVLNNPDCKWMKRTKETMDKYGIRECDLNGSIGIAKGAINARVRAKFTTKMEREGESISKLKHFLDGKEQWIPEKAAQYMKRLTRKQASMIFKARTRMIKAKGNYKNGHSELTCRSCQKAPETQTHVLHECDKLKDEQNEEQEPENIFSEEPEELKEWQK